MLVTGAARGMGESGGLSVRCGRVRAGSLLVDVDPVVEAVGRELDALAVVADVREPGRAEATVELAREEFGGLEGLANVAGIHRDGDVTGTSDEIWSLVVDVNLVAPFQWARAAIPLMLAGRGGAIVNIASIGASNPRPRSAAYSASKSGLLGLTRAIAINCATRCPLQRGLARLDRDGLSPVLRRAESRGGREADRPQLPRTARDAGGDRCALRIPAGRRVRIRERREHRRRRRPHGRRLMRRPTARSFAFHHKLCA